MSWLSDFAGRAETLLNQLDSEAASVLTVKKGSTKNDISSQKKQSFANESGSQLLRTPQHHIKRNELSSSTSVPGDLHSYFKLSNSPSKMASLSAGSSKSKSSLTSSLQGSPARGFGNTSRLSSIAAQEHDTTNSASKSTAEVSACTTIISSHSRHASIEQNIIDCQDTSANDTKSQVQVWSADSSSIAQDDGKHSRQSSLSSAASYPPLLPSTSDAGVTSPYTTLTLESNSDASSGCSAHSDSYVTVEYRDLHSSASGLVASEADLLKKEVLSLNQEIKELVRRVNSSHAELQTQHSAAVASNRQLSEAQKRITLLQQREMHLQEEQEARCLEVSALQGRTAQLKAELAAQSAELKRCQQTTACLSQSASVSAGRHRDALDSAEAHLKDVEAALAREKVQHQAARDRVREAEDKRESLETTAREAVMALEAERGKQREQAAALRAEAAAAVAELEEYKAKARHILASKEAIIEGLKTGLGNGSHGGGMLEEELKQARAELELCRDEVGRTGVEVGRLRAEKAEAEHLYEAEASRLSVALTASEDEASDERRRRKMLEEESERHREEVRCLQEELSRHKVQAASVMQEIETQMEELRKQASQRSPAFPVDSSATEQQGRVSSLTEALLERQAAMEDLTAQLQARNAQLDRLQKQYQESQRLLSREAPLLRGTEDVRSRVPTLLVESPFDGGVTRRVKRAYTTLDRLSVGLGVLLRRYPVARILVLLYMLLLHLWVLLVLLTYTPEVHPEGYSARGGGTGGLQPPLPPAPHR